MRDLCHSTDGAVPVTPEERSLERALRAWHRRVGIVCPEPAGFGEAQSCLRPRGSSWIRCLVPCAQLWSFPRHVPWAKAIYYTGGKAFVWFHDLLSMGLQSAVRRALPREWTAPTDRSCLKSSSSSTRTARPVQVIWTHGHCSSERTGQSHWENSRAPPVPPQTVLG